MSAQTILIIDDNLMNREMASDLLEEAGFQVILAKDGNDGVTQANTQTPDLILMDIHLPDRDGFQVSKSLKAISGLKDIPIVAFTAMTMSFDKQDMEHHGCIGIIPKPIDIKTFATTVQGYVQNSQLPPLNFPLLAKSNSTSSITGQLLKSVVSHDLKSPVCNVKTALQLLSSSKLGNLNEAQQKLVKQISETTNDLLDTLDCLHSIYLYENETFPLNIETISTKDLISKLNNKLLECTFPIGDNSTENQERKLTLDIEELARVIKILCSFKKTDSTLKLSIQSETKQLSFLVSGVSFPLKPNETFMNYCHMALKAQSATLLTEKDLFTIQFCL